VPSTNGRVAEVLVADELDAEQVLYQAMLGSMSVTLTAT
jgi:hypothetical protein